MRFGFALPGRGPLARPDVLIRLAQEADALRFAFAGALRRGCASEEAPASPKPVRDKAGHRMRGTPPCRVTQPGAGRRTGRATRPGRLEHRSAGLPLGAGWFARWADPSRSRPSSS